MDKIKIAAAILAFITAAAVTMILSAQEGNCAEPGDGLGRVVPGEGVGREYDVWDGGYLVEIADYPTIDELPERENPNDATKFLNRPFVESEWTAVTATAYCSCADCCGEWAWGRPADENGEPIVYGASGEVLKPGVSVASNAYPEGTVLEVYGYGTYVVEDRGGLPGGVDFYTACHEDAAVFGLRTVYVREITK